MALTLGMVCKIVSKSEVASGFAALTHHLNVEHGTSAETTVAPSLLLVASDCQQAIGAATECVSAEFVAAVRVVSS